MSGQDMVVKKLTVQNGCEIEDYTKIAADLTVEGTVYANKGINVDGHSFTGEQLKRAVDGFDGMLDKWDGEPANKCLRLEKNEDDDTKWNELYHNTNKDDTGDFLIANAIASRQQIATPTGFIAQTNDYKADGTDLGMKHRSFMVPNAVGTENLLTDNIYPLNGDTVTVQADNLAVNNLTAADGDSINVRSKINFTAGVGDLNIDNLTVNNKTTLGPDVEFTGDSSSSITYPGTLIVNQIETTGNEPTIMKDIKVDSISSATDGKTIAMGAPVEGAEVLIDREKGIKWDKSTKTFYRFADKKPVHIENYFANLDDRQRERLENMCPGVKAGDWSDLEIFYLSQFTWSPNTELMKYFHCLNETFITQNVPENFTLEYAMLEMNKSIMNNDITNTLIQIVVSNKKLMHKILLYYKAAFFAFGGIDIYRGLDWNSKDKIWEIRFYDMANFSELHYRYSDEQLFCFKAKVEGGLEPVYQINDTNKHRNLALILKGLILGTYTYIWYNELCNKKPVYIWSKNGKNTSIIPSWSENIQNVDNLLQYKAWWMRHDEESDPFEFIFTNVLNFIKTLDVKTDGTLLDKKYDVEGLTVMDFYANMHSPDFEWSINMVDAEIDYTISTSKLIMHIMEIKNSETGERNEVARISSRVLSIPEIQIAILHGDTQLTGKLTVDNISSSGTDPVHINYADIKQLMINGQVIKPCPANVDCNMGYVTNEYTLYPDNDITHSNEDVGNIGHVNNAAKVYVDCNNCGYVHFITVRPIIIKDNVFDGKKLFEYYKPSFSGSSLTPEVNGRFTLDFRMNPYSFPIIPRTRIIAASQGSSQGISIIPPAIFNNGTKTVTNKANYHLIATTRYNLVQELIKNKQEPQYYVKEMGSVEFFTVESRTNSIFLRWTRQQPDDNGDTKDEYKKPDKYKDYMNNSELLVIDGFSFTAHDQNSNETEYNQYYQNTSYGDKS